MKVIPYVFYSGNCEEALSFYVQAVGATIEMISRYGDAPMPSTDEQKQKIMHARFTVGKSELMASDGKEGQSFTGDQNVSLSVDFSDVPDMKEKYEKLSAGGKILMPLQDTFWGATFGMFIDKYGIHWMFNCDKKPAAVDTNMEEKTLEITV